MTRLIMPENGATVELHTPCQRDFTGGEVCATIEDWLNKYRGDNTDCTFPLKVVFGWESDREVDLLEISENADLSGARRFLCNEKRCEVGNFKVGTRYYWRVNCCEARVLYTEDIAPRWLEVDGLSNVRDMGGWKTSDGRHIKQGLLYRGTEMDTHHTITDEGRRIMLNELGIRTDLDLRREAVGKVSESPAGNSVKYLLMPCLSYDAFMSEEEKPVCKALFDVLADKANYPIYFHCWGGADRTGTLALMLEAVLGLSDADMVKDYELTSFSIWDERSRKGDWFVSLLKALEAYGGAEDSIRDKALRFLRSCGVSEAVMEKIRTNLIEQ